MLSPLHDWLLKWGMSEAGATLLTRLGGVLLVLFVALIANRVTKSVVVRGIARRCCMNAGNSLIPLILRFCPKNVTC